MDLKELKNQIISEIGEAYRKAFGMNLQDKLELSFPPEVELGDFTLPCFGLAKNLKISPADVAKRLAGFFLELHPSEVIEIARAAGPYLNIRIKNNILFESVILEIESKKDHFGHSDSGGRKKVMVEYLSPNTNKPLHLGHARNGALGTAVANILQANGYDAIKAILINDRGVHICKSMLAWLRWGGRETPDSFGMKGDHLVGKYYVRYAQELEKDPKLEQEVQEMLKKWEAGDEEVLKIWQLMNGWVYAGYQATYEKFGLKFDEIFYESETYKSGKDIIEAGLKTGVFHKSEAGAVLFDLPETEFGLNKDGQKKKVTLIRADGTSVYMTQDVGTAVTRAEKFDLDQLIYIVGSEQIFHFQVLFKILSSLGYSWAKNLYHLSYGMVALPEGKMKSREGTVVDTDDLVSEVEDLVKVVVGNKDEAVSQTELDRRACVIAVGAIKFQLLRVKPSQDIKFDPKESIAIDGFTGPYCQYAYARIFGILRNAESIFEKERKSIDFSLLGNRDERALIQKLIQYPLEVRASAEELNPLRVLNAVYEITKAFNLFYNNNQVLDSENSELSSARLSLSEAVSQVIKNGLEMLGIEVLERM
jgi:arginyl-tRNA synthetase